MSKEIKIVISEVVYKFLKLRADERDTVEILAAVCLEEGINLELTLRDECATTLSIHPLRLVPHRQIDAAY